MFTSPQQPQHPQQPQQRQSPAAGSGAYAASPGYYQHHEQQQQQQQNQFQQQHFQQQQQFHPPPHQYQQPPPHHHPHTLSSTATNLHGMSMSTPAGDAGRSRTFSPEAQQPPPETAEAALQRAFQADIAAAAPLFSAKQIATRHLSSGFSLHGGGKKDNVLYTTRMLGARPRAQSSGVSPVVVDYHDDTEHGKRTMRAMKLDRKYSNRDEAKAFVERNGISILGRMEAIQQEGALQGMGGGGDGDGDGGASTSPAAARLPGMMNRKNRQASPSSSHTHLSRNATAVTKEGDGSLFRFSRKVHPHQLHHSNLTSALLPVRRIKTPSVNCLASPARSPRGMRSGPRHCIDTTRVLVPDMIPHARSPRLRSLAPPSALGQGLSIKEDAEVYQHRGGLRADMWRYNPPTDPFGGEQ